MGIHLYDTKRRPSGQTFAHGGGSISIHKLSIWDLMTAFDASVVLILRH